jgi:hypothetical protein
MLWRNGPVRIPTLWPGTWNGASCRASPRCRIASTSGVRSCASAAGCDATALSGLGCERRGEPTAAAVAAWSASWGARGGGDPGGADGGCGEVDPGEAVVATIMVLVRCLRNIVWGFGACGMRREGRLERGETPERCSCPRAMQGMTSNDRVAGLCHKNI